MSTNARLSSLQRYTSVDGEPMVHGEEVWADLALELEGLSDDPDQFGDQDGDNTFPDDESDEQGNSDNQSGFTDDDFIDIGHDLNLELASVPTSPFTLTPPAQRQQHIGFMGRLLTEERSPTAGV